MCNEERNIVHFTFTHALVQPLSSLFSPFFHSFSVLNKYHSVICTTHTRTTLYKYRHSFTFCRTLQHSTTLGVWCVSITSLSLIHCIHRVPLPFEEDNNNNNKKQREAKKKLLVGCRTAHVESIILNYMARVRWLVHTQTRFLHP